MIDFKSTLKMSLISLKVNKMRSILTSLGIIIGVSAVIVMLSIVSGARENMQGILSSMGSNLLTIRSASAKAGGVRQSMGSRPTLTLKDANSIKKNISGIEAVSVVSTEGKQLMYGNQNWSTTVYGVNPQYLYINNYEIERGRNFGLEDERNTAKVVILGSTVTTELFGDLNPIDRLIRIGNVPFKVIGILKSKGSSGFRDNDDLVFIPITTAQRKLFGTDFPGTVGSILVKGEDSESLDITQKEIEELLKSRHHISKTQDNDFEIRNSAEIQENIKTTSNIFSILMASVASVSLLVGGIGIMNIMLVSVTERTKEIGIRMAIGAKSIDIRLQFLIEALILSMSGGIVGIITGVIATLIIGHTVPQITPKLSFFPIFISFLFSGLVGIGFGFYPAYKASLLNPIDALRYE